MYRSKKKIFSDNINDKLISLVEYTYYKDDDKINYFNYAVNISYNTRTIYGSTKVQNEKVFKQRVSPCKMSSVRKYILNNIRKINFGILNDIEIDNIIQKINII